MALYINDSNGNPNLLSANRDDDGRWLDAYCDKPGNRWNHQNGFAFVVSPISLVVAIAISYLGVAVCFFKLLCQAPSCRPASASGFAIASNLLLLRDPVSQAV